MRRLRAAAALELRVQHRYRIVAVAVILTAVWTLALVVLPAGLARELGGYVLLLDTATFGALFVAALVLFERAEGALAALAVSPLPFGAYLGVRLGWLTVWSVGAAVPLAVASGAAPAGVALVLPAVGLVALLFLVLSFALAVPHRSLTGFLVVVPVALVPLLVVPVLERVGLVDHPARYLVPTSGAVDLLRAGLGAVPAPSAGRVVAVLGYLAVWVVAGVWLARWRFHREFYREIRRTSRRRPVRDVRVRAGARPIRRRWWVLAITAVDVRTLMRSALLSVLVAGPLLLALAIRFGYPPLADYLRDGIGVDLAEYRALVLVTLVVLHVPLMLGTVGALLLLDAADDRTLLVLRVSPVTLGRYLAYRVSTLCLLALPVLLVSVPLSGLGTWSQLPAMLPALVLAAAQTALVVLVVVAFAGNKVEGLAVVKLVGLALTGCAPALWWLPEPAGWVLRALPAAWVADAAWHPTPAALLAGAALTALGTALLFRRARHHLAS